MSWQTEDRRKLNSDISYVISQAGNSLLAAQMYGSAGAQTSTRTDAPARRPDFEQAAREARDLKASPEKTRSFPLDRVELRQTTETPRSQHTAQEAAIVDQERSVARDVEEANRRLEEDTSRFAREAPGTAPRTFELPGSRLDITI